MTAGLRIGMFDSGIGGLSVLAALRARLPGALLHYIADAAHAPYGERSDEFITDRSLYLAHRLHAEGAQAIVVACNTATAVAVDALRATLPVPVVGVEPGLKPALAATRNGRVAVMATAATVRSPRMQALVARLAGRAGGKVHVHLQACDGLAAAIEDGDAQGLRAVVAHHCAQVLASGADTVALGCTHYVFAREEIQAALGPGVTLVDTTDAVARRVAEVCAATPAAVAL